MIIGLWGNGTIRVLTGFLTLYIAFVAKSRTDHEPLQQAMMLGLVGAAAGLGNFAGNATGARLKLGRPALIVLRCTASVWIIAVIAALTDNLMTAALATLIASAASALAKVSLDASLQHDLPEESIASGFGRSETVLQLSWVLGGALGGSASDRILDRVHCCIGVPDDRASADLPELPRKQPPARPRREATRSGRTRSDRSDLHR